MISRDLVRGHIVLPSSCTSSEIAKGLNRELLSVAGRLHLHALCVFRLMIVLFQIAWVVCVTDNQSESLLPRGENPKNQLVSTPHHAKPTPVSELILDDESPPCTRTDCRVSGLKRAIYLAARLDISCARLGLVGLLSVVFGHILSLEYRSLVFALYYCSGIVDVVGVYRFMLVFSTLHASIPFLDVRNSNKTLIHKISLVLAATTP